MFIIRLGKDRSLELSFSRGREKRGEKVAGRRAMRDIRLEARVEREGDRESGAMWKGISCGFNYGKDK